MPLTASRCASSSKPASIVAGFTPQESSRYEASCLDGKKALVKAKYDEKVGCALELQQLRLRRQWGGRDLRARGL
jgi:hypothetical protein